MPTAPAAPSALAGCSGRRGWSVTRGYGWRSPSACTRSASTAGPDLERQVRLACRQSFFEFGMMERILPDIAEVLDAGDDSGEIPGELEGRAVTLADPAAPGRVRGEPEQANSGQVMGDGVPE